MDGGKHAERRAAWWYRVRGYRVLARNAWVSGYELDLVVRRGRRLVFCEVKAKGGDRFGEPEEMVTAEKQRRLALAAEGWLALHPEVRHLALSFDVIAIDQGRLRHVAEAF